KWLATAEISDRSLQLLQQFSLPRFGLTACERSTDSPSWSVTLNWAGENDIARWKRFSMQNEPPISEPATGQRLQKVLAAAGLGSRRDCEDLIREGRVEVDRRVVTELGTRVDPTRQEIRVDGEALPKPKRLYFAVNKPVGVVTTNEDPSGRTRVIDLVPTDQRVFAVGRLDRSSE